MSQSRPNATPTTRWRAPPKFEAYLGIPDTLECLAVLAADADSHREAAGSSARQHAIRQRMGTVRFKV